MSTLAGQPLYSAAGYEPIEQLVNASGGVPVPLIRREKTISHQDRPD
jgi:hypothetical protein